MEVELLKWSNRLVQQLEEKEAAIVKLTKQNKSLMKQLEEKEEEIKCWEESHKEYYEKCANCNKGFLVTKGDLLDLSKDLKYCSYECYDCSVCYGL